MKKTWLITGCSTGLGRGIAAAVLEHGDRAVVTARKVGSIKELCEKYPEDAMAFRLDVTKKEEIDEAVAAALRKFGQIDCLVNNAGYGYRGAMEEASETEIDELFRTNFFGPVRMMQKVLPIMRRQGRGYIINISSSGALEASVGSGFYAATKVALEQVSDSLRKETAPLGIRVLIVEPGALRTDFRDRSLKESETVIDAYRQTSGSRRKENLPSLHDQIGSPEKAGKLLVELIERGEFPDRLLLGSDAVATAGKIYRERMKEAERWESVSVRTDYYIP